MTTDPRGGPRSAIGAPPDRDEFLQAAGELLFKLFPGENVAWKVLDAKAPAAEVRVHPDMDPYRDDVARTLIEIWEDHPLVLSYVGDTQK